MDVQMPNCDGYEGKLTQAGCGTCSDGRLATKLIRKHRNPEVRNILIIAMTASAIEGDRQKCLDSGMNNYLAKPVRAQTLKSLLESYLHKEADGQDIPGLQAEAKMLVKQALDEGGNGDGAGGGHKENNGVRKAHNALVDEETGETRMRSRPASVRSVTQRWLGPSGKDGKSSPS
jgi:DNA-binding response OmpR family regulator